MHIYETWHGQGLRRKSIHARILSFQSWQNKSLQQAQVVKCWPGHVSSPNHTHRRCDTGERKQKEMKLCETVDERFWRAFEVTMCVTPGVKTDSAYPVNILGCHHMSAEKEIVRRTDFLFLFVHFNFIAAVTTVFLLLTRYLTSCIKTSCMFFPLVQLSKSWRYYTLVELKSNQLLCDLKSCTVNH